METTTTTKTTVMYQLYTYDVLHMCFDNENAILRFVNRMHKVGLFTEIKIYKITTTTTRELFTADYL